MLIFMWIIIIFLVILWLLGKLVPSWKDASLKDKVSNIDFISKQAESVRDISIEKLNEAKDIVTKIKNT